MTDFIFANIRRESIKRQCVDFNDHFFDKHDTHAAVYHID